MLWMHCSLFSVCYGLPVEWEAWNGCKGLHTTDKPQSAPEVGIRMQSRGGQQPVVSAIAAGGNSSAFLTSTPDEFPAQSGPHLLDRCPPCSISCASLAAHAQCADCQEMGAALRMHAHRAPSQHHCQRPGW